MKIGVVIVTYNISLGDSQTLKSLLKVFNSFRSSLFELYVYDNSVKYQTLSEKAPFSNLQYYHDPNNGGLCAAYNYALNKCKDKSINWLLLLDQDSLISESFLNNLELAANQYLNNNDVVAILPHIISNNVHISPSIRKIGGIRKEIPSEEYGFINSPILGINSGTTLKTDFMQSLGGFNTDFKLDMLDYWYFSMINKHNKKIFLLKDIMLHNLSVLDYNSLSVERYKNIIKAESLFFAKYTSTLNNILYRIRLLARLIKQLFKVNNKRFSIITTRYLISIHNS